MAAKKTILFVTSSRSDFATIAPLLRKLHKDRSVRPLLFVTGDHTQKDTGKTYKEIQALGFKIDALHTVAGSPAQIAGSVVQAVGRYIDTHEVDYVLLCADRKEMLAAGVAATLARVPIFHIHGGDVSYGMPDDAMRHALSKFASVHFTASPLSAKRLKQMGEESWRVHMTGSPDLDGLKAADAREVLRCFNLSARRYALVLLNPEIDLGESGNRALARSIISALHSYNRPIIVLYPNNDQGSSAIRKEYAGLPKKRFSVHRHLPRREYAALLANAEFLIGNSSSGIIEAASFKTPVVNVGKRQNGRERNKNTIDASATSAAIGKSIKKARGMKPLAHNIYGDGKATQRICAILKKVMRRYSTQELLYKKFPLL